MEIYAFLCYPESDFENILDSCFLQTTNYKLSTATYWNVPI